MTLLLGAVRLHQAAPFNFFAISRVFWHSRGYIVKCTQIFSKEDFLVTFTCACGKVSHPHDNGGCTVLEIMERSGFVFVASYEGKLNWICDECYEKAHELAKQIHDIVGDDLLFFSSLLRKPQERKEWQWKRIKNITWSSTTPGMAILDLRVTPVAGQLRFVSRSWMNQGGRRRRRVFSWSIQLQKRSKRYKRHR